MRAEVKKRVLICLGVGLVLEAVLGLFAWAVLSRGDPPLDPIEALAMLTQLPAWMILRAVGTSLGEQSAFVAMFLLQSLFYAALCYAVLHLLARGRRKQIIWALISLGLGVALEAILLFSMKGLYDHNPDSLLAQLMKLAQLPSLLIFQGIGGGMGLLPMFALQSVFIASLFFAGLHLLARKQREKMVH